MQANTKGSTLIAKLSIIVYFFGIFLSRLNGVSNAVKLALIAFPPKCCFFMNDHATERIL